MKNIIKLLVVLFLSSITLRADIHTDLQDLVVEGNNLKDELVNFTFHQDAACMEMGVLNQSIEDFTQSVANATTSMTDFSATDVDMDALTSLSYLVQNMSIHSISLSMELTDITATGELFEYSAGVDAILQLSQDIGAMADRILEMADRILIMADNIGLMADRIITTQVIQSQNLAVTQSSILITQQNMILLSDSLSTIAYNLTLGQIVDDVDVLSIAMQAVSLNSLNMEVELTGIEAQTVALLERTTALLDTVVTNSAHMSHYVNADTLTMLGDLSRIYVSLGASLEAYSGTIEQIAPLTDTVILSDATDTMLQLTKNIGVMSDRIMQMADKIFIMADNIGLMADRIAETQNIQMTNVALTESSLLSSQSIMITVIKNFGL
ncbi:hypothetical protein HUE87_05235 [Candidatus Sulfurimonas marisnigri]|uniref:Methyl-accepting transducer domain-containing protein n=1 Tax=Candidatus Sulfurimonas marisnigri TaxID=2740405 RepID=A0A7S7RRC8_9BACT|nr:hypothetical protein [Candidatus Sulfurimonas marisnigri]QOY55631.1 hypothetical protein HUE87_05235 [Candidatus Sulfurimonas marisnigri]